MQIGFNLAISGPTSSPEDLIRIALEGEGLGYDYLTFTDDIVVPNLRVPGYPYSESGEFFGEGPERRHEQLTAAAFIAAKTTHIRLVLAAMVVSHRPACSRRRCCRRSTFCPMGVSSSGLVPVGRRRNLMPSFLRPSPRAVV
jgi:hypothetical protein